MPPEKEQQIKKQQDKNHYQNSQQDLQRESMHQRNSGFAPEQIQQNNVQQQRDIFVEEAPHANLFDDFVLVNEIPAAELSEKSLKKARKKLVNDNSQDESDSFSLFKNLGSNPFKILEWLKGSAEAKGASESYSKLVTAFEKMVNGTVQNIKALKDELMQAASSYLGCHSKKPVHLYGRQRVTMCREILANIDYFPFIINWQKYFCKDAAGSRINPEAKARYDSLLPNIQDKLYKSLSDTNSEVLLNAIKKNNPNVTEVNDKTLVDTKIPYFERNCVPMMRIEPGEGYYQQNPLEKEKDAKWNKEWIESYIPMLEAYEEMKAAEKSNDTAGEDNARKKLEEYKAGRTHILEEMVNEIMSITEDEMDRMINDPEYYVQNAGKIQFYAAIGMYASPDQNPIESGYFSNLPPITRIRFEKRCKFFSHHLRTTLHSAVYEISARGEEASDSITYKNYEKLVPTFGHLNTCKVESYHPISKLDTELVSNNDVMTRQTKINNYFAPLLKTGNEANVISNANNSYQSIMNYIDKYKNKNGQMSLPPIENAQKTLDSGSLEEKYALLMIFSVVSKAAKAGNCLIEKKYDKIADKLQVALFHVRTSSQSQTGIKGVSHDDAMKLGFISSAFGNIIKQNLFLKMDKEVSNLIFDDNVTEEEKEAKIRETNNKLAGTTEGLLFEAYDSFMASSPMDPIEKDAATLINNHLTSSEKFIENLDNMDQRIMLYKKSIANNPSIHTPLTEEQIKRILKNEVVRDKAIPGKYIHKKLKIDEDANEKARIRAENILKKADEKNKKPLNDTYSAHSETLLNTLLEQQELMFHYYELHFSDNLNRGTGQYILSALRPENVKKSDEQLTWEELKNRGWNKVYAENYKKLTEHDERGASDLSAMLVKRIEDLISFDITPENLLDNTWILSNYAQLENLCAISGFIQNIKDNSNRYSDFIEKYNQLPYKDVLDKKLDTLALLVSALHQFKVCLGLSNDIKGKSRMKDYEFLSNFKGSSAKVLQDEMDTYDEWIEKAVKSIAEYRKVRDEYLKKPNRNNG